MFLQKLTHPLCSIKHMWEGPLSNLTDWRQSISNSPMSLSLWHRREKHLVENKLQILLQQKWVWLTVASHRFLQGSQSVRAGALVCCAVWTDHRVATTSQPFTCEQCRVTLTETGMNSAVTGAKGWTPPCQNSTCALWLPWGSFHLPSDPSAEQETLPSIYVRKGRNTTYFLFLCTHRNHFTSKPGLLNKTIKTPESRAKMLKNLCSQISLGSHSEWSPSLWIYGDKSLTSLFKLVFFAASHVFQLSELFAQALQTQNPNSTTKSKYLFLKKLHSLLPEQTLPFADIGDNFAVIFTFV